MANISDNAPKSQEVYETRMKELSTELTKILKQLEGTKLEKQPEVHVLRNVNLGNLTTILKKPRKFRVLPNKLLMGNTHLSHRSHWSRMEIKVFLLTPGLVLISMRERNLSNVYHVII